MKIHEVVRHDNVYDEVEFVCHNERHANSTPIDRQDALAQDLSNMDGIVVLRQDWSTENDGRQISLSAIVLDKNLLQQVKNAAKRRGVKIDMVDEVNDDYVNRALRGEHDGQIQESRFRNAAMAGVAAASLAGAMNTSAKLQRQHELDQVPKPNVQSLAVHPRSHTAQPEFDNLEWSEQERSKEVGYHVDNWAESIAQKYRIDPRLARTIVVLAIKHEDKVFPRATDILAVIGVESSFNPSAVSKLRRDPARGLMQVRPGVWKIDPSELNDIEKQIVIGVRILKKYYARTGDEEGALHAYNIGITNYRAGKTNPAYVAKVEREKSFLTAALD